MANNSIGVNAVGNSAYVQNFNKRVREQFDQFMSQVISNESIGVDEKIYKINDKLLLVDLYRSRYNDKVEFWNKRIEECRTKLLDTSDNQSSLAQAVTCEQTNKLKLELESLSCKVRVLNSCINILNDVKMELAMLWRVMCLKRSKSAGAHRHYFIRRFIMILSFTFLSVIIINLLTLNLTHLSFKL